MSYNQGNDIRPKKKRTDIFHPDACLTQTDDIALGYRYDTNGINQIP